MNKRSIEGRGVSAMIYKDGLVKAMLSGRKWVTRRVIHPQPRSIAGHLVPGNLKHEWHPNVMTDNCRFGGVGDLIYVKEAWQASFMMADGEELFWYAAGRENRLEPNCTSLHYRVDIYLPPERKWVSPRHMPGWASRLWLEIISVSVDRLNNMTEQDVVEEGFNYGDDDPIDKFSSFWNECVQRYRPESVWENNPWVWVIKFKEFIDEFPE